MDTLYLVFKHQFQIVFGLPYRLKNFVSSKRGLYPNTGGLSSDARCSENLILIEQKGRLSLNRSQEKSGTFMCLTNFLLSNSSLKGKGIIGTNSRLSRVRQKPFCHSILLN